MRYFKTLLSPIFLSLLIISAAGCKKENNKVKPPTKFTGIDASVLYSGSKAADGYECGWFVKIGLTLYHADNLPAEYEKNLDVKINYELLNSKFQCVNTPRAIFQVIHIDSISSK